MLDYLLGVETYEEMEVSGRKSGVIIPDKQQNTLKEKKATWMYLQLECQAVIY